MKRWQTRQCTTGALCVMGICILSTMLWAHRTQGPIGGFRAQYTQQPVVEQTAEAGRLYEIIFSAFDMGHEVHMLAYARWRGKEELYQELIRVSVKDPDGNAYTVYRDHAAEVLDEPVRWAYRRPGIHIVTVELRPFRANGKVAASATFEMLLERRSPTPVVLMSATGVVMVTILVVLVVKRRRRNGA